jgi:phage repressor protein C with HTH and peptisase S24 domain
MATNEEGQAHFRDLVAGRVRKRALALNLNASKLSKILDISSSAVSNYWTGKRAWPLEVLPFVASALDTNVADLTDLSNIHSQHLPVIDASSSRSKAELVQIAEIDLRFGLGSALMDEEVSEQNATMREFPLEWLQSITRSSPDQLYWAKGQGDSMEPKINDGDIILIDRSQKDTQFGDLYWAIAYGQTAMIKRLRPMPDGSVKILSDNAHVPHETAYDDELHVFGRVIAVVKRI